MQQWPMCFNSSKYHFDFPSLLTRDGSEQYRSPPITINAVLAWLHDIPERWAVLSQAWTDWG